jgi:hypothetical protein
LSTAKTAEEADLPEESAGTVTWLLLMAVSVAGVAAIAVAVAIGMAWEWLRSRLHRRGDQQDTRPVLMRIFLPGDRRGA